MSCLNENGGGEISCEGCVAEGLMCQEGITKC